MFNLRWVISDLALRVFFGVESQYIVSGGENICRYNFRLKRNPLIQMPPPGRIFRGGDYD